MYRRAVVEKEACDKKCRSHKTNHADSYQDRPQFMENLGAEAGRRDVRVDPEPQPGQLQVGRRGLQA